MYKYLLNTVIVSTCHMQRAVKLSRISKTHSKRKKVRRNNTYHIAQCEIKSHRILPLWKPFSNLTEFSDHLNNTLYEEIYINHTLLCLSQASYIKLKIFLTILWELQSDFCKNLTEFYWISLKNLGYLIDFSPQLMACVKFIHFATVLLLLERNSTIWFLKKNNMIAQISDVIDVLKCVNFVLRQILKFETHCHYS